MTDGETHWPWWCMWGALGVVGVAALGYRMEATFGPLLDGMGLYTHHFMLDVDGNGQDTYTFRWGWALVLLALALGAVGLCGILWQTRKRGDEQGENGRWPVSVRRVARERVGPEKDVVGGPGAPGRRHRQLDQPVDTGGADS